MNRRDGVIPAGVLMGLLGAGETTHINHLRGGSRGGKILATKPPIRAGLDACRR